MIGRGAMHRPQGHRAVERDQPTLAVDRQRQQIGVGELSMPQQMGWIEQARLDAGKP
jgi:hypothetical protein